MPTVSATDHPPTIHAFEPVMGTVVTFDVRLDDPSRERELYLALARARSVLHRVDAIFSLWKPESPMSRVRRGELDLEDAPAEIAEVLARCVEAKELTRGFYDALALPGGIDPTGLVKGWGTERAMRAINAAGFFDVLVNAGGDVAASGGPNRGEAWRVGIRHPNDRLGLLGVVEGAPAVATSGTYERGSHLFHPHERRFSAGFVSATVVGPELALADALATGLCVAGEEGLCFLAAIEGFEGFGVTTEGAVTKSSGFFFD
ncbi:MAG: FAD:protein FMN transferase [Acidimicrobiales bacterium]